MSKPSNNIKSEIKGKVITDNHCCFAALESRYFINEEKKTIVCKVIPVADGCNDRNCFERLDMDNFKTLYAFKLRELSDAQYVSIGKAVCLDSDEYNEQKGKEIAYRKAMIKLNNKVIKMVNDDIKALDHLRELFSNFNDDYLTQLRGNEAALIELTE